MAADATSAGSDLAGLIRQHQAGVWRYLRVLGCDSSEAEDLTQETFLAVLQKPIRDYHPAATAAYLRKVARSLFISSRRRAARVVELGELDALELAWNHWAGDDGGETLLAALESCLEGLAERARRALELRFRDKLSRVEIAAAVGLSEDGAKNLMQRAKQRLRECVERKIK